MFEPRGRVGMLCGYAVLMSSIRAISPVQYRWESEDIVEYFCKVILEHDSFVWVPLLKIPAVQSSDISHEEIIKQFENFKEYESYNQFLSYWIDLS